MVGVSLQRVESELKSDGASVDVSHDEHSKW